MSMMPDIESYRSDIQTYLARLADCAERFTQLAQPSTDPLAELDKHRLTAAILGLQVHSANIKTAMLNGGGSANFVEEDNQLQALKKTFSETMRSVQAAPESAHKKSFMDVCYKEYREAVRYNSAVVSGMGVSAAEPPTDHAPGSKG